MNLKLPDIYYFNPTCEYAVANGSEWWQPNQLLQKMEYDLDLLPMFFASPSDYVLVKKLPSESFLSSLRDVGMKVPSLVPLNEATTGTGFREMKKNRLLPWGWSPAAHQLLAPLKNSCSAGFLNSPNSAWSDEHRRVRSKSFALELLQKLIPLLPPEKVIQPEMIAEICTTRHEIENLITRWGKIMVKLPWSSSGRGLQPVTKTPVHEKVWEKLMGMVRAQGAVITEPYLEKVFDMAFQFELSGGKVSFIGTSRFITDSKGQYRGNYLNGLPGNFDPEIKEFINSCAAWIIPPLIRVIEESNLADYYDGKFGVDTLVFRHSDSSIRINPCLEINLRYNMGLVSLELEKFLDGSAKGLFGIWYSNTQRFKEHALEMKKKHPLKTSGGKITSGFVALTEPNENAQFGAWMLAH